LKRLGNKVFQKYKIIHCLYIKTNQMCCPLMVGVYGKGMASFFLTNSPFESHVRNLIKTTVPGFRPFSVTISVPNYHIIHYFKNYAQL